MRCRRAKALRNSTDELIGLPDVVVVFFAFVRQSCRLSPHRRAILPPETIQRPAWQGLSWIPLALPIVQHAARCEPFFQSAEQHVRELALVRTKRGGVPFCP